MDSASQKTTPIIFKGNTAEYFGIWIVNLLLTILTLGIYSAWAKVRRKKYFYNNTLIEDVGFDYHAKPVSILKGRIIAFIFFFGYSFSANINPILPIVFMLILFAFIPWLVVRGSIFNARNSSHRGLRFDFIGTTGEAVKVFIVLPILIIFTLGLIIPYISHQKNRFLMNGHQFGLSQFEMSSVVKQFYKVYLVVLIVPLLIGILAAIAIPAYQQYVKRAHSQNVVNMPNVQPFVAIHNQANIVLAANETTEVAEYPASESTEVMPTVERVYSDNGPAPESDSQIAAENAEQVSDAEVIDETQPQIELTEAEQEEMLEEMMRNQQQKSEEKMREMMLNPAVWLGMAIGFGIYVLFIFGFAGYLQARIGQLVWNNTTLDKLSFDCHYRARDFIWLYFSNIVIIMLTLGLATPWAQIRMARYRASKLQIVGDVDFDQFVGDKKAEVKATGEEMAEMFDVDLSFG
ncbi:YjgN family protein [Methylotenera versatilis]|uniref:YjgN family protein n=1 Tax=Methylotenera versatilis TaxID=1055487 RepID=UPI0006902EA6|nr:YjgN family protein [Methylotenera versatilis]